MGKSLSAVRTACDHHQRECLRCSKGVALYQMPVSAPGFPHLAFHMIALHCIPASAGCKPDLYGRIGPGHTAGDKTIQYSNASGRQRSGIGGRPIKKWRNQPPTLQSHRTRKPLLSNCRHSLFANVTVAYGKTLATFPAASCQHIAAILICHSGTESMLIATFPATWLISTFHGTLFVLVR